MLDIDTTQRDEENTFKILIATDIHMGYNEDDPIRGDDSFKSFEEALQIAKEQNVDFILLGGDLFHENKPTQHTMQKAVNLIKEYSFGDKEINFQVVQDFEDSEINGSSLMEDAIPELNYCNPNLNIAYPIFSIHGNHDDPTGMKSISTLDTLDSMGLVNYIGRSDKLTQLDVKPLVLMKGETQMVIYGIGHLADKRFVRMFRDKKVTYYQVNADSAFQMLLLHQNRANRGSLNFLPFNLLPKFMDLVMWGHEHDCFIEPTLIENIYFTQPGSTVATSLSEGEAIPKHVGILYVNKKSFYIEPIPLMSARTIIYRHEILDTVESMVENEGILDTEIPEHVESVVKKMIQSMLSEAQQKKEANFDRYGVANDMLPLIRLVVQITDDRQMFTDRKMGLWFHGQVANPNEIVLVKRPAYGRRPKAERGEANVDDDLIKEGDDTSNVMTFIRRELETAKVNGVFTASGISEALDRLINCNDGNALDDYNLYRQNKCKSRLDCITNEDTDEEKVRKIKEIVLKPDENAETNEVRTLLLDPSRVVVGGAPEDLKEEMSDDDDTGENVVVVTKAPAQSTRGARGTRRARAGVGSRARGQKKV